MAMIKKGVEVWEEVEVTVDRRERAVEEANKQKWKVNED